MEREDAVSALNEAIEALNLMKELSNIMPTGALFGSVSVILRTIRVSFLCFLLTDCRLKCTQDTMIKQADYVELGLACADICTTLYRGLSGKRATDLNYSALDAISQLAT